jgi:hypothetical protein
MKIFLTVFFFPPQSTTLYLSLSVHPMMHECTHARESACPEIDDRQHFFYYYSFILSSPNMFLNRPRSLLFLTAPDLPICESQ